MPVAPVAGADRVDVLERGKYLATAGNCETCHTRKDGQPFSGGVPFETPFGTIYSTNITPDDQSGIGKWSASDLRRAMHQGIAADGSRLFPAFPYPSYTRVRDEDVDAIYAYLRSLQPVRYTPPSNSWLLRQRWAMYFWNLLFFEEGRYSDDPAQSTEWNRGAYLVEGLGHCGACHTPRNMFMAEATDAAFAGGTMRDHVLEGKARQWAAVNLTAAQSGLAAWSVKELKSYLHTGFSPRAGTFGPMNEVIVNSLSKLAAADVQAMAVYIKSLPARERVSGPPVSAQQAAAGKEIFEDRCAKCHMKSGRGGIFSGPPLAGSAIVQADDPSSLINIILYGATAPEGLSFGAWETMKPFGTLDDSQVAAVGNYVRGSWGNRARAVTAQDVAQQR